MPRINIKPTVEMLATKIEHTQQSELGIAHDNVPISFYTTKMVIDIAKELEIDGLLRKELEKRGTKLWPE